MSSQTSLPTLGGGSVSTPTDRTAPLNPATLVVAVLAAVVAAAIGVVLGVEAAFPDAADMSGPRIAQGAAAVVAFLAYTQIVAQVVRDTERAEVEA